MRDDAVLPHHVAQPVAAQRRPGGLVDASDEADAERVGLAARAQRRHGAPQRLRVARAVEAADIGELEDVAPLPCPASAEVVRVEAVLDGVDGARAQPALRLQLARPGGADGHDGVGGAEHAALQARVERARGGGLGKLAGEVDARPGVAEVGDPGQAAPGELAPQAQPDKVRRVGRAGREDGVDAAGAHQAAGGAGGERHPADARVGQEDVRAQPERGALRGGVGLDAAHGDGLLPRAARERTVEAEGVERPRPDHPDALRHVGRQRGVQAGVGAGPDRQHDRLDAGRAEVLGELERALHAGPARGREVVGDEQQPEPRAVGGGHPTRPCRGGTRARRPARGRRRRRAAWRSTR